MKNVFRVGTTVILLAASFSSARADDTFLVYQDNQFTSEATISTCSDACSKQMAVVAKHQFVFDGDYSHLTEELEAIAIKVTVYDDSWADAESGELVLKVSSTVHARQRWRRTVLNQPRKVENVSEAASAIYAVTAPGQTVSLEFNQTPVALSGTDFTINVRRFQGSTLVGTGSYAVSPTVLGDGGGGTTMVQ